MNDVAEDFLQICKQCAHEFRVPVRLAGKRVACPHCRRLIELSPAATPEDKLVDKTVGGCRLIRRLGAGALGVVYEAEQLAMRRHVAMKLLSSHAAADQQLVARFQREARIAAEINHPHVVAVYDCGLDRGVHFLVMEYVDGSTLAGLIDDNGPLPWQEAARLVLQVAEALDHLGGREIVHRDIKPANILITREGVAKLADLGLAKHIVSDEDQAEGGLTMQGVAMGSPAYMAPEQVRNARDAGHAADIYSLGATLYQALTAIPPYEGRNATEVMTKVLREEPRPLRELAPTVPEGVASLVHKMLSKDPADRPQDAAEFIAELRQTLAAPTQARPRRLKPRAGLAGRPQPQDSRPWMMVAIIAAVVAAAALIWALGQRG